MNPTRSGKRGRSKALCLSAVLALTTCGSLLAACTSTSPPPQDNSEPSPSLATGPDPEISATCVAFSMIATNLSNAERGHQLQTLSDAQWTAVVNTVPVDALVMVNLPGLREDLDMLERAIHEQLAAATGEADFNPNTVDFRQASQAIHDHCDANGTPLTILVNAAGG